MILVLMFVILDIIILTTVTAIDSSRYTVMSVRDRENPDSVQNVSEYSEFQLLFILSVGGIIKCLGGHGEAQFSG